MKTVQSLLVFYTVGHRTAWNTGQGACYELSNKAVTSISNENYPETEFETNVLGTITDADDIDQEFPLWLSSAYPF